MKRHILVAVDESPEASRALEKAAELARAVSGRLTLVSAIEHAEWGRNGTS